MCSPLAIAKGAGEIRMGARCYPSTFHDQQSPKCPDRDSRIGAGELLRILNGRTGACNNHRGQETTRICIDRMEKGVAPAPKGPQGTPQETSGTGITPIAVLSDEVLPQHTTWA